MATTRSKKDAAPIAPAQAPPGAAGTAIMAADALTTALTNLNAALQGDAELSDLELLVQESDKAEELDLDLVKMARGGDEKFTRSDGSETEEIVGIVISFQRTRGFWENHDDLTLAPFCSSTDGFVGTVAADIDKDSARLVRANDFVNAHPFAKNPVDANRTVRCRTCPMNLWGSALKGSGGKACSERRRLPILEDGTRVPVILSLPPTSLTPWKKFCTKMSSEKAAFWAVKTKLYVLKEKSRAGFEYGVIGLEKVADLDDDNEQRLNKARAVLALQKAYDQVLAGLEVTSEEYYDADADEYGGQTIDHEAAPADDIAPF